MNIAKTLGIPAKSAEFFAFLAQDAGNWSGTPWLDGNANFGRGSSAMSQTLIKQGLITVGHGDGGKAFAIFTGKGIIAAAKLGIDLRYVTNGYFTSDTTEEQVEEAAKVLANLEEAQEEQVEATEKVLKDTQTQLTEKGAETHAAKICKKDPSHGAHRVTRTGSYCYTCDRILAEQQKADRAAAKVDAQASNHEDAALADHPSMSLAELRTHLIEVHHLAEDEVANYSKQAKATHALHHLA